jgi:hypothetical protein
VVIDLPAFVRIVSVAAATLYRPKFATYAVRPSLDSATSCGPRPTGSFTSVWPVAASISETFASDLLRTTSV